MGMSKYHDLSSQAETYLRAGDWDSAYSLLKTKELQGDPAATALLGEFYIYGIGVPEDLETGINMVEQAIANGCSEGTEVLSGLFLQGEKVPIDNMKASKYIRQGAEMGNPAQMGKLAYTYYRGTYGTQDDHLAFQWAQKAAKLGDFLGMVTLAALYYVADSPFRDPSQAAYWYRECLNRDPEDTLCLYRLATCLVDPFEEFNINPSEADYEEAFMLLSKGVEKGDLDCHMLIAWFYEMGYVVPQDYNMAYKYFKLAADNGHEASQELLKRYRKNIFGNYYVK